MYGVATYTEIDERPIFIINSHGNGDIVRGGVVICTLWSCPSILHAPTVMNISNQSPCCLSICEQFLLWSGEKTELGLDAVVRNDGGEATENEAPSRYTGAAEPRHTEENAAHSVPPGLESRSVDSRAARDHFPHVAGEARRTVDAGEQRGHGASCGQIEGGTATSGRAACLWMGGHDDGYDHEPSTLGGRQAESGDIHVECEVTGDSPAEHLLEPVQKKHIRGIGSSGSVQWTLRLSPSCASSSKP